MINETIQTDKATYQLEEDVCVLNSWKPLSRV